MEIEKDKPQVIHRPKKKKKPVKSEENDDKEVDVKFSYTISTEGFFTCTAIVQGNLFVGKSLSNYGDAKSSARMMAQKYLDRPATTVEKMGRSRTGYRT